MNQQHGERKCAMRDSDPKPEVLCRRLSLLLINIYCSQQSSPARSILSARVFSHVPTVYPPRPRNVALCATYSSP